MADTKYVFISYSSKDNGEATLITKLLDNAGVKWWKAPEKIPEGSSYAREIRKAIEESQVFMLLISQNSLGSIWVEKELDCAVSARKEIIPFNLDETKLNDTFDFYLGNVQIIYNRGGVKSGPAELIEKVKASVEGGGTAVKKTITDIDVPLNPASKPAVTTAPANAGNTPANAGNAPAAVEKKMIYSSVFSLNRVPACCMYCGDKVSYVNEGVYVCTSCDRENYDDFTSIKNYIRQNGPCTVTELANKLHIPRKIINSWWEEENRN